MKPRMIGISLVLIGILTLFYWPTFRWLFNSWNADDYYSHGFLVPVISGFLIWINRGKIRSNAPSTIGSFVLALGAGLYILGSFWDMRSIIALSLPIVITALSLSFLGIRATRVILFPLAFLIFMIPFPFVQDLGFDLQEISTDYSAGLLDILGFPVTSDGPDIHLDDQTFTVGIACSGLNSLIALFALAAIYAYMLIAPLYKQWGLVLLAFPIAILANVLRISSIIMVAHFHNVDTATGWYHDLSSPLFFFVAFLLLILVAWLLKCRLNYGIISTKR